MVKLSFILMLLCGIQLTESENILAVFYLPFKSHYHVYEGFLRALSLRGHHVTVLTLFPSGLTDQKYQNFTEIKLGSSDNIKAIMDDFVSKRKLGNFKIESDEFAQKIVLQFPKMANEQMRVPGIKEIIESSHFDLVFFEWLGCHPLISVIAKLNVPIIGVSSMDPHYIAHDAVGNPAHPVLSPDPAIPLTSNLNFFQKLKSIAFYFQYRLLVYGQLIPMLDTVLNDTYGSNYPYIGDSIYKIDLLFLNKHEVFSGIRPNVPAVINLGSLHLKAKSPLPNDLQSFLDNSREGVVYFSLGSAINGSLLPDEIIQVFVQAFTQLPYKILWKWESNKKPVISKNIKLIKWVPQQDLLGHQNVKCFLTQGGQQSLEEAIENEVPLIAMPFYGDQINNAIRISEKGIGLSLQFDTITTKALKEALTEVITNSSYKNNIRRLKTFINDQPMKSMDKAIWWTEYVLRHKGAAHLRSPALDLPFYEYYMLDIVAFVLAVITLFLVILFIIVKYILKVVKLGLHKLLHKEKIH